MKKETKKEAKSFRERETNCKRKCNTLENETVNEKGKKTNKS